MSTRGLALAVLGLVAAGACSSSTSGVGPVRLRAQAGSIAFQSGLPAELDVALGTVASAYQIDASATSDRGVWSLHASLTRDQALAGQGSLTLGSTADATAELQISGATTMVASAGTLDLTFGAGQISGAVTGASADFLDGAFTGDLFVACWVPPAALADGGSSTGGTTPADAGAPSPDAGSEALVLDADFATAGCVPFRPLGN